MRGPPSSSIYVIPMQAQCLASKVLTQQVNEKGLEDLKHAFTGGEIARFDTPAVRPGIDVERMG